MWHYREADDKGVKEQTNMAEIVEGTDSSGTNDGQVSNDNNTQNGATGNTNTGAVDGSQAGDNTVAGDEGNDPDSGVVTDDNGKKFWPEEAVMARIAKLTSQKHNAEAELLESIKTNPEIRKKLQDALQIGEESATSSEESEGPTPFEEFLAPLPSEHQAVYRNMGKAMASEFESYVQDSLKEALAPIMNWIGESKLNQFSQTNKDFDKYKGQIQEIMSNGRAKTVEDAYKIATYEDKLRGVSASGARQEADRQKKMSAAPVAGRNSGGGNLKTGVKSLSDALERAGRETGYVS